MQLMLNYLTSGRELAPRAAPTTSSDLNSKTSSFSSSVLRNSVHISDEFDGFIIARQYNLAQWVALCDAEERDAVVSFAHRSISVH